MSEYITSLDKRETALLIIDMQNDFCKNEGVFGKRGKDLTHVHKMIPKLKNLLEEFRKLGVMRVFIKTLHFPYTTSPNWGIRYEGAREVALPGMWGAEFVDELKPLPEEPIVVKHRYSAFLDTDLNLILRCNNIRNVVITGVYTHVCIDTTARHAFMLDYKTIVVKDCVASFDPNKHSISLEILNEFFGHVLTSTEVLKLLVKG